MIGIEWLGTAASVIVAISLTQKNLKALRLLNLIGSIGFSVYGFFIKAWPVFGLNGFIAIINIWYLFDLFIRKDQFSHYFCDPDTDPFCREFLRFYRTDILRFYPGLLETPEADIRGCVILRNLVPVSLVIFQRETDFSVRIIVDYATPSFRDFRNAKYFLEKAAHSGELKQTGELIAVADSDRQCAYFRKLGYLPVEGRKNTFRYLSAL